MNDLQFDAAGYEEIKTYFEACGFQVDAYSMSRETKGRFEIKATWTYSEYFVDSYEVIIGLDPGCAFSDAVEKLNALADAFGGWAEVVE